MLAQSYNNHLSCVPYICMKLHCVPTAMPHKQISFEYSTSPQSLYVRLASDILLQSFEATWHCLQLWPNKSSLSSFLNDAEP